MLESLPSTPPVLSVIHTQTPGATGRCSANATYLYSSTCLTGGVWGFGVGLTRLGNTVPFRLVLIVRAGIPQRTLFQRFIFEQRSRGSSPMNVFPRWGLWTEECPNVYQVYGSRLWYRRAFWVAHLWTEDSSFPSHKAPQYQDGHLWETYVYASSNDPLRVC